MSISGYAIVLMVCPLGEACEMVAIAPQKYQTVQECQAAMQDDAAHSGFGEGCRPRGPLSGWAVGNSRRFAPVPMRHRRDRW